MKLSGKLFLSFSIVIVLVGGIGLTSSYINSSVKDQVNQESKQSIEEVRLAGEMTLQLYRSLVKMQYILEDSYRKELSTTDTQENLSPKVVRDEIQSSFQEFEHCIKEVRELIGRKGDTFFEVSVDSSKALALVNDLEEKSLLYSKLIEQFQTLSREDAEDGKEFFTVTIEPYFRTTLLPIIEELRDEVQVNHEEKIAGLNEQLSRIGMLLILATIFALFVALVISFYLYRSIRTPLNKIAVAANNIGRGNLDDRINYHSKDELGQLSTTFDQMAESLSRTTVSRDYVDSIIESMADLLLVTNNKLKITRINQAGMVMLNCNKENQVLGENVSNIFEQEISLDPAIRRQNATLLVREGTDIPVSVSKGLIQSRKGETAGYVIVASDISSEKEAQRTIRQSLREKEVLLTEIHDRVKNNLAVISGLLQMQIWETENDLAVNALQESRMRVRSIALVHEMLYQSDSLSEIEYDNYIGDLLSSIKESYKVREEELQVRTCLERVILNVNQAIPCSLLLNELIVHAVKEISTKQTSLEIYLTKEEHRIKLSVKDKTGTSMNINENNYSLLYSLIDTLSKQLGGDLHIYNTIGSEVVLTFEAG